MNQTSAGCRCLLLVIASLAGCTGGGSDQSAGIDRGGVRGGIAIGVVTGFGSVFVNGVRYSTDAATITVDGRAASETELALGQVVAVEAELAGSESSAVTIVYDSDVIGPVEAVDPLAGQLRVLGQVVQPSTETWWGGALQATELAGVVPGDWLRVSGLRDATDRLIATRIDLLPAGELRLRGIARDSDDTARTFRIGGQPIDYSAATLVSGFPDGAPRDGDLLRVTGSLGAAGELLADTLQRVAPLAAVEAGESAEIEGIVTALLSPAEFLVGSVPVLVGAETKFEHGDAAALAVDRRVEVDGEFDADGRLRAREIEFEDRSTLRVEGTVSVKAGSRLTILGIPIEANGLTPLDAIQPGDCAKVGGYAAPDQPGLVIATRLERDDACGSAKLRGIVNSVAAPQFEMLGVTVVTDAATVFPDGSAADFFAAAPGQLVEAKGHFDGTVLLATEVEFKD